MVFFLQKYFVFVVVRNKKFLSNRVFRNKEFGWILPDSVFTAFYLKQILRGKLKIKLIIIIM